MAVTLAQAALLSENDLQREECEEGDPEIGTA